MIRGLSRSMWMLGCMALLGAAAPPASAAGRVGVAPFEKAGAGEPPDVATRLADRLLTAGVDTVGPDRLGVPAVAEPDAKQVVTWAEGLELDAIVFGRVTGIGGRFSVDVQVRSTEDGQVQNVHVTEISRPGAVESAVDDLARKVVAGLAGSPGTAVVTRTPAREPTAAPASGSGADRAPSVSARPEPAAPAASGGRDGGGGLFSGGSPLRITSDTLEARQAGGARHMIFQRNVRATRDDVVLTSERLDAFYPKGSSRPEKIVATGRVVMKRDDGEAHCTKMTYIEAQQMIHCEGDAELVREGDVATGDKIEWDLETDTVFIRGNADVLLTDAGDESGT